MLRFIIRRLLQLIPILLGLSVLLFAWLRALPGGPAQAALGERATPEDIARYNETFGLDQPVLVQYAKFLGRALQLDFGTSSRTGRPVATEFLERFPGTVELTLFAMVFAIGLGIPLGYLAARRHGTWIDSTSVIGSLLGVAVPVFFLAYLLRLVFAVELGLLPGSGRQDVRIDATHITNFYVLDGLLTREWDAAWDAVVHLVLPGVALGTIPLAIIVRITRASVLDVVNEDYVRTANAKGLAGTSSATRCCRCPRRSACRPACCSPARCSPRRSSPSAASVRPCATRSATGTTPCCRASSSSSRWSTSW